MLKIAKIKINTLNWLYSTYLGSLYLQFLLWLDRRNNAEPKTFLTPKEISQIVRSYSLVDEGVTKMKSKVNALVTSKSKEEYQSLLNEIEDMISYAEEEIDTPKAQLVRSLREIYVKKGTKDIVTATDRAKMIDQRIQHTYEVQQDRLKRQLLRDIRQAQKTGDFNLVNKLQMEYNNKYGRHHSRS